MRSWKVRSESNPDKSYIVRETKTGLRCECPAFVFNDRQPCKHINRILDYIMWVEEL